MNLQKLIKNGFVFIDGGMGTQLQAKGLKPGEAPEEWNITNSHVIEGIHRAYFEAGANIATSNTFGANPIKTPKYEEYIISAINNAKLFINIQKEFGSFGNYILSFFPNNKPINNSVKSSAQLPVSSPQSDAISKDMKKRGFTFFGTTICYAFLQATGFVNDHLDNCLCKNNI